ncbi:MAG: hypothetical protein ACTSVY_06535 [Candidatus Helarchaeota archaeon]
MSEVEKKHNGLCLFLQLLILIQVFLMLAYFVYIDLKLPSGVFDDVIMSQLIPFGIDLLISIILVIILQRLKVKIK